MNKGTYSFNVGNFKCLTVYDGFYKYQNPIPLLFPTAPRQELKQALAEHQLDSDGREDWVSDYSCTMVDTGGHKVLIDTGMGIFNPFTGLLPENLKAEGIDPGEIDYVVLTHAHPDHIGGLIDAQDQLVFPNAKFVLSKEEWEFWTTDPAKSLKKTGLDDLHRAALVWFAEKCLPPLQSQVWLMEREEEIVPGIAALKSFGHTPGHLAFRISSAEEELLCTGDAFINPLHGTYPDWSPTVDVQPEAASKTRRILSQIAVETDALVSCFHFPFPCLGRIREENGRIEFQQYTI